jgi:hypothetical protein
MAETSIESAPFEQRDDDHVATLYELTPDTVNRKGIMPRSNILSLGGLSRANRMVNRQVFFVYKTSEFILGRDSEKW